MKNFTTAIIVAAGNSTRMGLSVNKTLISILDKPSIYYSLYEFNKSDLVDEIILVTRLEDKDEMQNIAKDFEKFKKVVIGGKTRTISVYNGVKNASGKTTHFAIHDGARALIKKEYIDKVINEAFICGAATLGTKVTDTIKSVDSDKNIETTIDRTKLFSVQTPQVFEKSLYLRAIKNAIDNDLCVTDDCSLIEQINEKVKIVEGYNDNIKLTTKEDLKRAKMILERGEL